jgi:hypothetical protein
MRMLALRWMVGIVWVAGVGTGCGSGGGGSNGPDASTGDGAATDASSADTSVAADGPSDTAAPSDASGQGTLTGTLGGGSPFVVEDIISIVTPPAMNGGQGTRAAAYISNLSNACQLAQGHHDPRNQEYLELSVENPGNLPPGPGTYTVSMTVGPNAANALYVSRDVDCGVVNDEGASAGSITFATVSSTLITGSYDVTFLNGDHVMGVFTAPVCPAVPWDGASPGCGM